jgi:hypothetical protein
MDFRLFMIRNLLWPIYGKQHLWSRCGSYTVLSRFDAACSSSPVYNYQFGQKTIDAFNLQVNSGGLGASLWARLTAKAAKVGGPSPAFGAALPG